MNRKNLLLLTDAYKQTHYRFLPKNIEYVYSYLESRGVTDKGVPPETLFFGLQMLLLEYLSGIVFNQADIDEADEFCERLFGANYFNRKGWERLLEKHGGRLPVLIRAVPEGTLVGSRNVLMTIQNTDKEFPWLVNFLETILLNGMWYPIAVATQSFGIKRLIRKYAEKTSESTNIPFHLNDFGFRGVSSIESAGIGGCAHLVNFWGTDTLHGIVYADKYYNATDVCGVVGMSVPASEHSATIAWGKDNEALAYKTFMQEYPKGLISIVSDSYDIYNAVDNIFGKELKDQILSRDGKLVVRPDSGYPPLVTIQVLQLLEKHFGAETNYKGYKVLNPKVGVIYGDFIKYGMIDDILSNMVEHGYATDNVVFGMGGALLQQVNRDTFKMAFKTSAVKHSGMDWIPVAKTPVTATDKNSKAGRFVLVPDGKSFNTLPFTEFNADRDVMRTVFQDGEVKTAYDFQQIRVRAEMFL